MKTHLVGTRVYDCDFDEFSGTEHCVNYMVCGCAPVTNDDYVPMTNIIGDVTCGNCLRIVEADRKRVAKMKKQGD